MLLCAFGNANLDRVNHGEGGVSIVNYLDGIIHTCNHNCGHLRPIIAVHGFRAAAPDKQSALDGHVIERDFSIRRAAADDEVAVHGHVFQFHIVGTNENATLDVLVVSTLGHDVSTDNVIENLRKFRACDIVQWGKNLAATMNIVSADHCAHIGQRPA